MRRVVFALLFALMLLTACKGSRENDLRQLDGVKLFIAMNGDVKYNDVAFSGKDAAAVSDLVKAECPQGVGDEFVRATFESDSSILTIYTTKDAKNITCSVLKPKDQKQVVLKPAAEAPDAQTALVVNGKVITLDQIKQQLAALPASSPRDSNAINQLVNRMINDELLRQEADKLSVTDDEVAKTRAGVLNSSNITESQLAERLATQNLTVAAFDESVKQQAKVEKLLKERLLIDQVTVSPEDAKNYYLQNPNQFLQSEQAVARFLLIGSSGRTLEQGRERAQQVVEKINTTDFCKLVTDFSDDKNSKANCGVYVVPRGAIDPNLELAAFTTPVNQTSVITTDAGIYFIQTLRVTPAQVVPFEQIATTVQANLRNALFQQRLNLYLSTLRSKAEITSYLG